MGSTLAIDSREITVQIQLGEKNFPLSFLSCDLMTAVNLQIKDQMEEGRSLRGTTIIIPLINGLNEKI